MVTQQLLDYIKQQTQMGKTQAEITQALLGQGWQESDVNQAFAGASSQGGIPLPINAELPKARQILNEAWVIYRNRFKTLVAITLIPTAGYLLFILLGIIVTAVSVGVLKESTVSIQPWIIAGIIFSIVVIITLVYFYVWATVAQLYAIKDQAEGIGWKEAYKRSRPKINPFFSTGLLSGLAVLGGFILFIIPGVIFALWFSQSPYVVVEEGLSNTSALKRSKYYVQGRWSQIFGKLFYMGAITLLLYIALAIVLAILASIFGLRPENTSWISNVFSVIWTPLVTVYGYLLYKYARATRP